jgi:tetratricopeptide (TPR) repeat protein/predicted Ser/Thr protein kinase
MIGKTVSHYRILSGLGHGGMGVVYLGEDTHLGRQVAIKFSNAPAENSQYRARFLREARAASALDHPHIARIYDYGETESGQPFIVMELVTGEDLFRLLQRRGVSVLQTLRIVEEAAEALGEAHRNGIVHRDIKPANIVINNRGQVKVLDFGLAKQFGEIVAPSGEAAMTRTSETAVGTVLGTPSYMSPEQAREAALAPSSDFFSLGAVLYECLAGRPAFTGVNSVDILAAVLHVDPPPPSQFNPAVTPELDVIALKALAKDPAARYQDAAELVADLRAARESLAPPEGGETELISVAAASQPSRNSAMRSKTAAPAPARRSRLAMAAGFGLLVAAVAAGWWLWPESGYRAAPDVNRWYQAGITALHDGTYYRASQALAQAVARDGKFTMAHARLAEAWLELDFTDKAKEEMLRAAPPGTAPRLTRAEQSYLQALELTLTGDFAGAAAKYQSLIPRTPEAAKADAYLDLGRAYERKEDTRSAIEAYREAARRQSQNPAAWLRLAVLYGRQMDQTQANDAFEKAEGIYRALGNLEGVSEVLYQRAVLANRLSKYADARTLLDQSLDISRHTGSLPQQIVARLQLSATDCRLGQFAQAQTDATQALDLARANGLENLTARGLVELGNAYFVKGDSAEARQYFTQSLEYARRYHSEHNEARALFSVGNLELRDGDSTTGLRDVEQALVFFQRGGYQKETASALILIARAQRQKGDYTAALQSFDRQLEVGRKLADTTQIALAEQGSASVLLALGRLPAALTRYQAAYDADRQTNDKIGAVYDLLNCANLQWRLGHYDEARRALAETSETVSRPVEILTGTVRAGMELSLRHFPVAVSNARAVLAGPGVGAEFGATAQMILGLSQAATSATREAIASTAEAVTLAGKSGSASAVAETGRAHAEALLAAGDSHRALETVMRAQQWFAQSGNQEAEWRCWLVAAQAAHSRDYALKAQQILLGLQQQWGADNYRTYLARPDIQFSRTQLDRLTSGQ